jgi:hypothetical protein
MERYLSGGGADDAHAAGDPLRMTFEATRYKPVVARSFVTVDPTKEARGPAAAPQVVDLKDQTMTTAGDAHSLDFTETARPGAYLLTLTKLRAQTGTAGEPAESPEYHAVAVNVDARREGDLRRAGRDDVTQFTPGVKDIHSPAEADWLDQLKNKQTDLTEAGWIFLALLLVLLAEQALAVKLSYHSSAGSLEAAAPSAAALFKRTTPPTGAAEPGPTAAA